MFLLFPFSLSSVLLLLPHLNFYSQPTPTPFTPIYISPYAPIPPPSSPPPPLAACLQPTSQKTSATVVIHFSIRPSPQWLSDRGWRSTIKRMHTCTHVHTDTPELRARIRYNHINAHNNLWNGRNAFTCINMHTSRRGSMRMYSICHITDKHTHTHTPPHTHTHSSLSSPCPPLLHSLIIAVLTTASWADTDNRNTGTHIHTQTCMTIRVRTLHRLWGPHNSNGNPKTKFVVNL